MGNASGAEKISTISKYFHGATCQGVYVGDRRHSAASFFPRRRPIRHHFEDVEQRLREVPRMDLERRRHTRRARREAREKRQRSKGQDEKLSDSISLLTSDMKEFHRSK